MAEAASTPACVDGQPNDITDVITSLTPGLLDMPREVLSLILSLLSGPADAMAAALACKQLLAAIHEAEMSLELGARVVYSQATAQTDLVLASLEKYMPSVAQLDLSNVPLDDREVAAVLSRLRNVTLLDLSGCRKLSVHFGHTSCMPATAAAPHHSGLLPAPQPTAVKLQCLSVQRCFQLNAATLTQLLQAAAAGSLSALCCLAMSHLDLSTWPAVQGSDDRPAPATSADAPAHKGHTVSNPVRWCSPLMARQLRILALHNCSRLTPAGTCAIVKSCPGLQYLLLGGSAFVASGGQLAHGEQVVEAQLPVLFDMFRELTLSSPAMPVEGAVSLQRLAHITDATTWLSLLAAGLPHLAVLELTAMPPTIVAGVRDVLSRWGRGARAVAQVWDLTCSGSITAALAELRTAELRARGCSGTNGRAGSPLPSLALPLAAVRLALKCAVACSSAARSTPLHRAAERDDAVSIRALLALGAAPDAREAGGATALFLAAETGHASAADALLVGGANATLSNSAGESPLYIAALRGHLRVVRCLLAHFQATGTAWQEASLYGDKWTPLMAAAVANRHDVAACLLHAAGPSAAPLFIGSTNRYGQSVMHIAARKGSLELLRLLLECGGAGPVCAHDTSGDTPMDVAKKYRHVVALAEFRRVHALG